MLVRGYHHHQMGNLQTMMLYVMMWIYSTVRENHEVIIILVVPIIRTMLLVDVLVQHQDVQGHGVITNVMNTQHQLLGNQKQTIEKNILML